MTFPLINQQTFNHITQQYGAPLYITRGYGSMDMVWYWVSIDPNTQKISAAPFDIPLPTLQPTPIQKNKQPRKSKHIYPSFIRISGAKTPRAHIVQDNIAHTDDSGTRVNNWNYMRHRAEYFVENFAGSQYLGLFHQTEKCYCLGAIMPTNNNELYSTTVLFNSEVRNKYPHLHAWRGDGDTNIPLPNGKILQPEDVHPQPWVVYFCGIDDSNYYKRYDSEHAARMDIARMNNEIPKIDTLLWNN